MNQLRWWMRLVGGFYILIALFNTPPVIEARLETQYPGLDVPVDSVAAQAIIDTWFMFGLEVGVIGVALLLLARNPMRHLSLIWVVIALEAVRGILDDIYLLATGTENAPVYVGWIVVHSIIIVTGIFAIRRARHESRVSTAGVLQQEEVPV